jgi:hypothetical protein
MKREDFDDRALKTAMHDTVGQSMLLFAIHLSEQMTLMLSEKGTGKVYRIGKGKKTHRASAKGHPPAVRTGLLRRSYSLSEEGSPDAQGICVFENTPTMLKFTYGTNVEYAAELEDTSKLDRPHLRPILNIVKDDLAVIIHDQIKSMLTAINK